jgi:hypothetical protein
VKVGTIRFGRGTVPVLLAGAISSIGCYSSYAESDDEDGGREDIGSGDQHDISDDGMPLFDALDDAADTSDTPDCRTCEGLWDGAGREPPVACPPQCTGGCEGLLCIVDCNRTSHCPSDPIECPDGMDCRVGCGDSACQEATIVFPNDGAGEVVCWGASSCQGMSVSCSSGAPCTLICAGVSSCQGSNTYCGTGACTVRCEAYATEARVDCGESCCCDSTCRPW